MTTSNAKTKTMEDTNTFRRFDIVSDYSDHHFATKFPKDCFSNSKSRVFKHIMREWKALEESLPESIYVRVYEGRIDLMRAVIVGAAGTPYHNGLFFFDIGLPSDYPTQPPFVHYRSFGLSLNPNLYGSGKVCLSLLNTWGGKKIERWDPTGSTLLQVLLSIQGLVLNEKPFFNEPWLVGSGSVLENKSRDYNERVFSLTCRSATNLIQRPPREFGEFVKAHFRERAIAILTACSEYANGRVMVGYYGCCQHSNERNGSRLAPSNVKVSTMFKGDMKRLYPQLVERFRSCGAVLEAPLEQLVVEEEPPKRKQVKERKTKTNYGIFKKAVAKIKKVLGWKNSGKKKMNNS